MQTLLKATSRASALGHVSRPRRTFSRVTSYLTEPKSVLKDVKPQLLVGGKFQDSKAGKTFPIIDPRTEDVLVRVAEAGPEDVDLAVAAARKAFDQGPWPRMTAKERGRLLYKLADKIEEHADEFAALEALDNGKPVAVARAADVPLTYDHFRYYAGWADKIHGKTIPVDGPFMAYTLHEPIGVVGQIIPWNFPLLMAAWKVAPALAAGNCVVLKPAEQTPLSALRLGELALEVGIPEGVLNILPGYGPSAGAPLVEHPGVDKVAFTGSTEIGRIIGANAGRLIKPVSLELGGKSPLIVGADVDVDWAADVAHGALFFNHGQCCCAGSRVYVHERVYDAFVEKATQKAQQRRVGDPFTDVDQGPQVDADQMKKILHYIDLGRSQGATMTCGGNRHGNKGYYVEPTVFADVTDDMTIAREEIFGPVQSILKWKSVDEVIHRANDSEFGLAAGVLSNDVTMINTLSRGLRAGTVWVNCYNIFDSAVPFGGYKSSGVGRDKGAYALEHYTQVKSVYMPLENPAWR